MVVQGAKGGVKVTQKVVPTGPWFADMRSGEFSVVHYPICHAIVNPVLDVQPYLPGSQENMGGAPDPQSTELYEKVLHDTDPKAQHDDMVAFEKYIMDTQAHATQVIWWNRILPSRSYVKGFNMGPSHYLNMDLATIWLDKKNPATSKNPNREGNNGIGVGSDGTRRRA